MTPPRAALRINWVLVTIASICVGFVACKPAVESTVETPKGTLNSYDQQADETDLKDPSENSLVNKTITNEEEFVNKTVNEETNRRPISTNPEHEDIGKEKESLEGGMFFDTADWVKEAEQWTFKGGEWGLVNLPDDDHPHIPSPPVPGPVLLAEGTSMAKVIVTRSESNMANLTLHFSYYLSHNPANPPTLEVYQIKDDAHSERVSVESTYGQWTTSTLELPFSGNFQIKFIGQRIVEANEIALDDIVLRGYYMQNIAANDGDDSEETNDGDDNEETNDGDDTEETNDGDDTEETNDGDDTEETNDGDDTEETNDGDDTEETNDGDYTEETNDGDDTEETNDGDDNYNQADDEGNQNPSDYYEYDDSDYYSDYKNEDWFGNIIESEDVNSTNTPVAIVNSEDTYGVNEMSEGNIENAGTGGVIIYTLSSLMGVCLLGLLYWKRRGSRYDDDEEVPIYSRDEHDDYDGIPYDETNEGESLTEKLQTYKSID